MEFDEVCRTVPIQNRMILFVRPRSTVIRHVSGGGSAAVERGRSLLSFVAVHHSRRRTSSATCGSFLVVRRALWRAIDTHPHTIEDFWYHTYREPSGLFCVIHLAYYFQEKIRFRDTRRVQRFHTVFLKSTGTVAQ